MHAILKVELGDFHQRWRRLRNALLAPAAVPGPTYPEQRWGGTADENRHAAVQRGLLRENA